MLIGKRTAIVLAGIVAGVLGGGAVAAQAPPTVNLSNAVVVTAGAKADRVERQAALMLRTEVENRTGLDWKEQQTLPGEEAPAVVVDDSEGRLIYAKATVPEGGIAAIVVGSRERMPAMPKGVGLPEPVMKDGKPAAEGYVLKVASGEAGPVVLAIGNDRRGTLYAVGRLLRALIWGPGHAEVQADLEIASAPAHPLRGIQLGYRALADTYDAWDMKQYVQYIRDLIVFGCNSIELIPSLYPGAPWLAVPSGVMPLTPWDHTVALPALLDAYDIDVWFFLALARGASPEDRADTLRERDSLFAACQRIDHVFVPGGDPGDTPPQVLMPWLKDLADVLRKHHPKAGLWVSTQGFEPEYLQYFYEYLQENQPDWLTGVVYGPWAKDTLQHTREAVPAKYPIRRYPDITHSKECQYPIPNWDEVWAQTYDRQPILPRPTQSAHIIRLLRQYSDYGALCYSDGTGDDVNKLIWNVLLWDPEADVRSALIQFARYHVGPEFAEGVADGFLMFEKNWTGPALTNEQIPKTLAHWQAMERRATRKVMASWRFQQGLLRAYVDAYVQARAKQETALLEQAYAELAKAPEVGSEAAMAAAETILRQANPHTAAPPLRARILELADMLNESIGIQLSIEKHGGLSVDRGALLDTMDLPLTDGAWLLLQFPKIREMDSEAAKLASINRLVTWEDPGPGGFYDDLGNPTKEPHLVVGPGWEKDPGNVVSAQDEHGGPEFPRDGRLSWAHQAETLYWTPLRMRYTGLDPKASYLLRAVPGGRFNPTLQLYFDGKKFGDPIKTDKQNLQVHEFDVPQSATADGVLEVMWEKLEGRGPQVAEMWLIKKQ